MESGGKVVERKKTREDRSRRRQNVKDKRGWRRREVGLGSRTRRNVTSI